MPPDSPEETVATEATEANAAENPEVDATEINDEDDLATELASAMDDALDGAEGEEEVEIDAALLRAALFGVAEEPQEPLSPQIMHEVEMALDALLKVEFIELEDDRRPALVAELATVVGEARSPRDYLKRFVRTVVHSDHVEEIYGSDDELRSVIGKVTSQ